MSSTLIDCLLTTDGLAAVFSDGAVLDAMAAFEAALARASAAAGVIPAAAAEAIAQAASRGGFDASTIASDARRGATPAIPFVKILRERVAAIDTGSATYLHWGATSQDVTDTALVLVLQQARALIEADHDRLERSLRALSDRHATTIMVGRTLLQPAGPTTFGLKVANWVAPIARSWRRLDRAWTDATVLQLGGPTGTLAAFGERGPAIAEAMARALGLASAPPWHTDRDRLGALVAAAGLYVATLAKAARDISLLMQPEVGEGAEPGGGSSSMPQKQNPSGCALVLAAATRMPGLVAAHLTAMPNDHERGVGGIQAEWANVAAIVQTTGTAAAALAGATEGLHVDPHRMRTNLEATRGTIFAERATLLLARALGRERAHALVAAAIERSRREGEAFGPALRSEARHEETLAPGLLDAIDRPEDYLGSAGILRSRLLGEVDG